MRLSAKLIKNFNSINSFSFADWSIRADEPNTLYFQLVDLDQQAYVQSNQIAWPGITQLPCQNALRYLTGIGVGATPVVVQVTFPTLNPNSSPLTIAASQVDGADSSVFKVDLTSLQVPSSGNVFFSVQEGSTTRKFFVQDGISVEDPASPGQC